MKAITITLLISQSQAFTTPQHRQRTPTHHYSTITEESYPSFLSSAFVCANSDSCSIDMAEEYLREIVRIESACVAGTMNGDACGKDVARVSEVVAGLREKVEMGKRGVKSFWQQRQDELASLTSSSIDIQSNTLSPVAALSSPLKPAYLAIAALYTIFIISLFQAPLLNDNVVPFTPQEIWWALRDGYITDLMGAYFKHGGLPISDSAMGTLTPQEVWWSIRDGYAFNLMSDWFRNGGSMGGGEFVAVTPQEVWWSLRDGYVTNLL